ncbi:MAG: LutB/LldF family L-lactate oxidation iron-sulfur protein, partial [Thermoleophilia bacterium]|nr:LutB/LldF family L-lactate oxidation iron-sulfur protein [Thermoleophilia bacterium]
WLDDYQAVQQGWHKWAHDDLGDAEEWRDAVAAVRRHTVAHLDRYLAEFAGNVERAGGHVFFAADAREAREYVADLARRNGVRRVVKVKSMVSEEIALDAALEAVGAEVTETDLGAYLAQLAGERPYHIIGPAVHMRLPRITEILSYATGEDLPEEPDALAASARRTLRDKFLTADLGVSGANFGVASTGTVVLVTNEGNGRMTTTLPPTHVVVMGMERLVPDWRSLEPLLTMLPRAGTGERMTAYVNAITGPRREEDVDGPEELHVVIVDNGRSRILGTKYAPVLQCIRCGSCADFCPVYRTMGGHAYDSVYTGPIGAVLTPLLDGMEGREHLPFASTLCGACDDACPARVPLSDLLLELRADVAAGAELALGAELTPGAEPKTAVAARRRVRPVSAARSGSWAFGFKGLAAVSARPRLWESLLGAAGRLGPVFASLGGSRRAPRIVRAWTDSRDLPVPAPASFRRLWRRRPRGGSAGERC